MPFIEDPNGWEDPQWIPHPRRPLRRSYGRRDTRELTDYEEQLADERRGNGDPVFDDDRGADAYERELERHFP
jgi:hypothetical protein